MAYEKLQASRAIAVIPSDTVNIPNPATLAISSTTTGGVANKLVDAAGDFVNRGVKIGDIIYNYTSSYAATVTSVDSATQLGITGAGMAPGRDYYLYASHDTPNNGCVLYVGVAGDVKVTTAGGDDVTFTGILAGSFIPVQVVKTFDTLTTATNIVALW